jgi:hypothetical protein
MQQPQAKQERSLGELFGDLTKDTATLVRQEVQLATAEMTQKAGAVGKDVGFLAIGGAVAYAGLLAIVAAIIILLATIGLPWWLAAALVGLVVAGIGYFLIQQGLTALRRTNLAPRQTMQTLKEDAEWIKEQRQ